MAGSVGRGRRGSRTPAPSPGSVPPPGNGPKGPPRLPAVSSARSQRRRRRGQDPRIDLTVARGIRGARDDPQPERVRMLASVTRSGRNRKGST